MSGCTYAKSWACSCVPIILGIMKETKSMLSPGSRKTMMRGTWLSQHQETALDSRHTSKSMVPSYPLFDGERGRKRF